MRERQERDTGRAARGPAGLRRGAEPHSPGLDDRQSAAELSQPLLRASEGLDHLHDMRSSRVVWQVEDDDPRVLRGRVVPDVCEVEVARGQRQLVATSVGRNDIVASVTQADITDIDRLVTQSAQGARCRSWQAGVHEEAHALRSGGQWVMLFAVQELARELQGSPDVFDGQTVLTLDVLEAHPSRQAPDDNGYWRTGPPNHGLAVTDLRVDDDPIFHRKKKPTRSPQPVQGWVQPTQSQAAR